MFQLLRNLRVVMNPIRYFSFWDVPRTFVFERDGSVYLLESEFDDELDDYPSDFEVYSLLNVRNLTGLDGRNSVVHLPKTHLGRVPVSMVRFDKSRRKSVDGTFLDALLK
jgi:hypothetical protein